VQITINGVTTDVDHQVTVADLVSRHAQVRSRIAVALNAEVVPRSQWETTHAAPGDSIELLTAAAGG